MGTFKGPSQWRYKIKTSIETFDYFGKERGFFARAWPLLLCVLLIFSIKTGVDSLKRNFAKCVLRILQQYHKQVHCLKKYLFGFKWYSRGHSMLGTARQCLFGHNGRLARVFSAGWNMASNRKYSPLIPLVSLSVGSWSAPLGSIRLHSAPLDSFRLRSA